MEELAETAIKAISKNHVRIFCHHGRPGAGDYFRPRRTGKLIVKGKSMTGEEIG